MKQIITVPHKDRININDIEPKVRNARQSNDYIMVYFGNRGQWIKLGFCKDQTYVVGYNFLNMEFTVFADIPVILVFLFGRLELKLCV